MKVFVTGGSGFLGSHLSTKLVAQFSDVIGLAMTDQDEKILREYGVTPILGSLSDPNILIRGMEGCDVVIHAAALMDHWGDPELFKKVNVEGTRNMLGAARSAGVKRFVQLSAASVVLSYSATIGNEDQLPRQHIKFCNYSYTKALAEEMVLAADCAEMATIAIRPPMIWGAGDKKSLPALVESVKKGEFTWVDNGNFPTPTCHVENVVEAVIKAVKATAHGKAYFITDGLKQSNRQVTSALLSTRGVSAPDKSMSRPIAKIMAFMIEKIWKIFLPRSEPPLTRSLLMLMATEFLLDDTRARQELGYVGEKSWEEGIEELREEYSASLAGGVSQR